MASPSARLVTGIATGTLCDHTVGQSMTSLRPQQARSPSCLAVIHRRCSALAPKTRNNLSCCSVCTRPTVHGLIATELLPDSSNLCNPGWTRRCSADTHTNTHTHTCRVFEVPHEKSWIQYKWVTFGPFQERFSARCHMVPKKGGVTVCQCANIICGPFWYPPSGN